MKCVYARFEPHVVGIITVDVDITKLLKLQKEYERGKAHSFKDWVSFLKEKGINVKKENNEEHADAYLEFR